MESDFITLAEAAKLVPGRPSSNALWRWCRRGVTAQSDERVKLRHVRMGRLIYTRREWIEEFGEALAAADARYFDGQPDETVSAEPDDGVSAHTTAERKLEEAGL